MKTEYNKINITKQVFSQFEASLRLLRDLGYIDQKGLSNTVRYLLEEHNQVKEEKLIDDPVIVKPDLYFDGIKMVD